MLILSLLQPILYAEEIAACHLVEEHRQCDERQLIACLRLDAEGERRREDDDTSLNRDESVADAGFAAFRCEAEYQGVGLAAVAHW